MTNSSTPDFAQIYGHLPPAFQPHDFAEHGARGKWRASILKSLPVIMLPQGLELRKGNHYQPPRFNYGLRISAEELSALAERHGLSSADAGQLAALITNHLASLGLSPSRVRVDPILAERSASPSYCITLADNHRSGSSKPAPQVVDAVRQFVGLGEATVAGWHLDQKWCNWQWKRSEDILLEQERQEGKMSQDVRR